MAIYYDPQKKTILKMNKYVEIHIPRKNTLFISDSHVSWLIGS